jgi:hypothetical protein
MGFRLTYGLEGAGWATVRIEADSGFVDVTVSYLHDSLRELAEAAKALSAGAESGRVVFMDEPGEVQLFLTRTGKEVCFEARWFDDWSSWGMHFSNEFKVILSGRTTVHRFVGEVSKELQKLLHEHGEDGYKAKWIEAEFPRQLHEELLKIRTERAPSA